MPDSASEAKTAGLVPPDGPLTRLRSAIILGIVARNIEEVEGDAPRNGNCDLGFAVFAPDPTHCLFSNSSLAHFLFLPHSCVVYNLGLAALLNAEEAFPRCFNFEYDLFYHPLTSL